MRSAHCMQDDRMTPFCEDEERFRPVILDIFNPFPYNTPIINRYGIKLHKRQFPDSGYETENMSFLFRRVHGENRCH